MSLQKLFIEVVCKAVYDGMIDEPEELATRILVALAEAKEGTTTVATPRMTVTLPPPAQPSQPTPYKPTPEEDDLSQISSLDEQDRLIENEACKHKESIWELCQENEALKRKLFEHFYENMYWVGKYPTTK